MKKLIALAFVAVLSMGALPGCTVHARAGVHGHGKGHHKHRHCHHKKGKKCHRHRHGGAHH